MSPPAELPLPAPLKRITTVRSIARRVMYGILFVLPILLTILVVYQIYLLLNAWVITPVALLIMPHGLQSPYWDAAENYLTPIISLLAVMLLLYLLGYLFQTRLNRWIDWIFGHIPGVSIVYLAIRDASRAMQGPDGLKSIDTVVLVPFPHPGARAAGFLMGESQDTQTGRPLVSVYIPFALFPPSGYTLVFPRDVVVPTRWEATAPWKLLLTGGLTVPSQVPFEMPTGDADAVAGG
jgi:uncharacterized membrane protein